MKKLYRLIVVFVAFCLSHSTFGQNGVTMPFAGGGTGALGDGGPALFATLDSPDAVAIDRWNNIYISEMYRVRKVNNLGIITTVAGTGAPGFSGDGGAATAAQFNHIGVVAVDSFGNLFIADKGNNRVRKVSTAGIVTTIVGNGSAGDSGDGGPATAATINYPGGLALDNAGNIYISTGNRVRKVDASGIIIAYAGTGVIGFYGDGGLATAAQFNAPYSLAIDNFGNVFVADIGNSRIRKIDAAGIITTIAGTGVAGPFGEGAIATSAYLGMPRWIFADDSSDLFIATPGCIRRVNHSDGRIHTVAGSLSGLYYGADFDCNYYIVNRAFVVNQKKELVFSRSPWVFKVEQCVTTAIFCDVNNNCIFDSADCPNTYPVTITIDSAGNPIDTVSASAAFACHLKGPVGTVYRYHVISVPPGVVLSCPATGIILDTVKATPGPSRENFGFTCVTIPGYDLQIGAAYVRSGAHAQLAEVYVRNNTCNPIDAVTDLSCSPKYPYFGFTYPPGVTISGITATWNILGMTAISSGWQKFVSQSYRTSLLPMGDTVHCGFEVTPTASDWNPANNAMIYVDTVRAGFDPNLIEVTPAGCTTSGTTLEYTIHFENTGNDTAHHVFVINTLSDYLDPQSFRLQFASHQMTATRIYNNEGHSIIKFDFPNINLPDSSHHGLNDGMVKYTIRTRPSLPANTSITNNAGIYFDINPVVITNTVENVIDCPPLQVRSFGNVSGVRLYPNPTSDQLTIKTTGAYSSFTITNSIGQTMIEQPLQGTQAIVNVKTLPPGLYLVTLTGEQGREVVKFVKR